MTWPSNIQFQNGKILKFRIQIVNPIELYSTGLNDLIIMDGQNFVDRSHRGLTFTNPGDDYYSHGSYYSAGVIDNRDETEESLVEPPGWDRYWYESSRFFGAIYYTNWIDFPSNYTSTTSLTGQFTFNFKAWRFISWDDHYNPRLRDGFPSASSNNRLMYSLWCVIDYMGYDNSYRDSFLTRKIVFIGDDLHNILDTSVYPDNPSNWSTFMNSPFGVNFTGICETIANLTWWRGVDGWSTWYSTGNKFLPLAFPYVCDPNSSSIGTNGFIGNFTRYTPMTFNNVFVKNRLNIDLSNVKPWNFAVYEYDDYWDEWDVGDTSWFANVYVS